MEIALTYLFGIGKTNAAVILTRAEVSPDTRTDALTEDEARRIQQVINSDYRVEGDLRREVSMNIKRLMDLSSYRGLRHKHNLPCRGQRTKTNARTRRGPRRAAVKKKVIAAK